MMNGDWRVVAFERRATIALGVVVVAYLLSLCLPLRLYTVNSFVTGFALLLVGITVRVLAIGFGRPGTSGRGRRLKADSLNTTGPYAWVRNPVYLGNLCAGSGLALMTGNLSFASLLILSLGALYRIVSLAEESFLEERFGEEYRVYKRAVPAFIPLPVSNPYKKLSWGQWNLNRVFKREHDTWYLLLLLAAGISIYRGYLSLFWGVAVFLLLSLCWALLKLTKRRPEWIKDGPCSKGDAPECGLSYLMVFFMGLTVGLLLFVANPDLFLSLVRRWL